MKNSDKVFSIMSGFFPLEFKLDDISLLCFDGKEYTITLFEYGNMHKYEISKKDYDYLSKCRYK